MDKKRITRTLDLPVIAETELLVLGGSCTGVFAAVRAAKLGVKTMIVEKQNSFGGVATQGLVTVWHPITTMDDTKQIIGGLTDEVLRRLRRIGALEEHPENRAISFVMNTEELKIELDILIKEAGVTPMLHTFYSAPYTDDAGDLKGVIVANKDGLGIILADRFVDATGDGDLLRDLDCETWKPSDPQPPTPGMKIAGLKNVTEPMLIKLVGEHGSEVGLNPDRGWGTNVPGAEDMLFFAPTHVYHVDCADPKDLTYAEIESRRHIRAVMDLLRKYYPDEKAALCAVDAYIGIRESRHVRCLKQLKGEELLVGKHFDDAVAFGTYPVDLHTNEDFALTWYYLDGSKVIRRNGQPDEVTTWLKPGQKPTNFYQIPLSCVIPRNTPRVIAAGRMLDADTAAFGAARVMVNLNQLGEAAGIAVYDSLNRSVDIQSVDAGNVRELLKKGGSLIQ